MKDQLEKFKSTYKSLYEDGKGPILQLSELGLQVPPEFKIAAEYTLSHSFNEIILNTEDIGTPEQLQIALTLTMRLKN